MTEERKEELKIVLRECCSDLNSDIIGVLIDYVIISELYENYNRRREQNWCLLNSNNVFLLRFDDFVEEVLGRYLSNNCYRMIRREEEKEYNLEKRLEVIDKYLDDMIYNQYNRLVKGPPSNFLCNKNNRRLITIELIEIFREANLIKEVCNSIAKKYNVTYDEVLEYIDEEAAKDYIYYDEREKFYGW